jgi:hypothetical protein
MIRTERVNLTPFQAHSYLHNMDLSAPRRLKSPEEEMKIYRRKVLPAVIGVFFLVLGFFLQLVSSVLSLL